MRTNTFISVLSMVAIHTQNLKSRREFILDKPFIKTIPTGLKSLAMAFSVIIDVIYCKKERFCLPATGTPITTVSHNDFILKSVVMIKAMFIMSFPVILVPLGSTCDVLLSVFFPIFFDPIHGSYFPGVNSLFSASFAFMATPTSGFIHNFKIGSGFNSIAFFAFIFHVVLLLNVIIKIISHYDNQIKGKVQRPFRKEVGLSSPKRQAPRTGDDMVPSHR